MTELQSPQGTLAAPRRRSSAVRSARVTVSAVVVTAVVALLAALGAPGARADSGMTVKVMTQNLYFGADLTPVIQTTTPAAFFAGVAAAYNQGVDLVRNIPSSACLLESWESRAGTDSSVDDVQLRGPHGVTFAVGSQLAPILEYLPREMEGL